MRSRLFATILILAAGTGAAQDMATGDIVQRSEHAGEMSVSMPPAPAHLPEPLRETLRFEPWQMLEDLFRDDIVLLMRHGPTDWSRDDPSGVLPTDCANQRVMTADGMDRMRDFGVLLAGNGIVPGRILVSEWCRNQQTLEALVEGISLVDPEFLNYAEIETNPAANLLLSLEGAATVTELRRLIADWQGSASGPLLIISHFTNIAELTEFHVYEGEILVLDPDRRSRVLGYLRLRSAAPDVGHFDVANGPR
jgi:phosphohistidine phosphatase SixA